MTWHDQWAHNERQMYCDTRSLQNTDTRLASCQPHGNRKKTKLLAYESVYWVNINDDIVKHI